MSVAAVVVLAMRAERQVELIKMMGKFDVNCSEAFNPYLTGAPLRKPLCNLSDS